MTVHQLVERERTRLRRMYVFAGLALAAGATCTVLAIAVSALGHSRWMTLPRSAPFLVWLLVLGIDGAVVWWTWTRLVRRASKTSVAENIEREQSLRAGALRGVLEIGDSGALGRRAAERMSATLGTASRSLAPRAQRGASYRALQMLAGAVVAALLLGWAAPVFGDGVQAILRPVHAWRGTLLPALRFKDLPTHVVRGEELSLEILAPGRGVVTLSQRMPGEAWRSTTIRLTGTSGVARAVVGPVRGDLALVANDGRSASDTVLVRVTDRPFLGGVSMRALYPAYLGRASEALPIGEPARVPMGTTIEITGRASTELSRVRLASENDTTSLQATGHAFNGKLEARRSGRWTWLAAGTSGPISDLPLPIELEVIVDSAPHVEILAPTTDTVVASNQRLALRLAASDDHGLASVELVSWKQQRTGDGAIATQRLAQNQSTIWSDLAELDLGPRDLQPGDILHVKVVAVDNSPWAQKGESRELLLKIPTMEEQRSLARAAADSAVRQARAAVAEQKSLEKRTDEAAKSRAQRSEKGSGESNSSSAKGNDQQSMSYEAAEQARNVAKDQRALTEKIQNLQKQAAALQEQLKAAGALDSSLARQLREAQDLLRQALTPELMAQMQKLEQATQKLEGDQARQSLKDLEAMQQRLREQLEKSAEMLKRAAYEGAMQTLKDEAKEIADRERQLADSSRSRTTEEQRNEAKNLADRADRFGDDVKKLQERLQKDKAEAGAQKTKEASQRADASEQKMREVADDLQKAMRQQPQGGEQRTGEQKAGEQKSGEQRAGEPQKASDGSNAERKAGEPQPNAGKSGEQKPSGEKQSAPQQPGKSGEQKQGGSQSEQQQPGGSPQKGGERQSGEGQRGQQGGSEQQTAREAAEQMDRAAQAMQDARDQQVQEWKKELTSELDRAIQETLQMAREETALEQKARSGEAKPEELRGQQSALKQGLDQTAQRLQQEGQKSSLLSGRSQRAVAEAQQKMNQAMQQLAEQRGGQQAASSMGDAAEALNRVAASLARDREKANSASSASGFSEMLQQLQELAKKQGSINSQAQGLMPMPNGQMSQEMQATARALARQQRQVAQQLEEMNDASGGDKAAQLAREARQLAEALDGGRVDAATTARQQQLFRRLLDAGRTLEKEERDDSDKREAKSALNPDILTPENKNANGKAAQRFREPDWNELRGLTPDQRRAILEYFKRINAQNP